MMILKKNFKKKVEQYSSLNIQWNWYFRFFHNSSHTQLLWNNLVSLFHWIMWAGIMFYCRHIIFTHCAFPRTWVPAIKLNTSNLFHCLLAPMAVVYVWRTYKKGYENFYGNLDWNLTGFFLWEFWWWIQWDGLMTVLTVSRSLIELN
jgi:hypothetical protein